jgi:N-acetylmuramoyl-L-alanine amidase
MPETVLAPVDEPKAPAKSAKTSAAPVSSPPEQPTEKPAAESSPPASDASQPANAEAPAKPADGSVDQNGHETGVSNPPADVSTTPSDEDQHPANPPSNPPPAQTPAPDATPDATPQSQNISAKKPARPAPKKPAPAKPAPAKPDASMNEIATLQDQPQIVRATQRPTTQPVVAEVTSPGNDATDTPPFAKSVVPGAAPQSAASPDAAAAKSDKPAPSKPPAAQPSGAQSSGQPPDTAPAASLNPPPKSKSRRKGKHAPADTPPPPDPEALQVHEADPTATGERSLVRALGLKFGRIVIDPGHGGHDAGTVGPDGIEEKDVVLDIGLRLGKLLRQRLGADVTFTRSTDKFVPLETRTAIANKAQADLFVSIHANSSKDEAARGVETYYLNFTSSPDALDVAARENAVSEKSIHELQDLVKKITLKDKIDESREFAADVEHSLYTGVSLKAASSGNMKDRGVKKAPFVVLIGANMPSILTEISFVSNPDDARQLHDPAYRERIAEALYAGIAKYINGLSSVRVAENPAHGAGN